MSTPTPDDLLDAYLRGKAAGAREGVYDQEQDGEVLTVGEVLEQFARAAPSDVLLLRDHTSGELTRIFLDAMDRRQFVYKVNYPDGYMAAILTGHGLVSFSVVPGGKTHFEVQKAPLDKSTLDLGRQIIETQERHRAENKGWWTETGEQFGRWYL